MRPLLFAVAALAAATPAAAQQGSPAAPLTLGETFTIESRVLGETRRINVYAPADWRTEPTAPRPVLYMPDGGVEEDFPHVAGLLQVSVMNGTMRPFLLVGIENTVRRRDLTPPTTVEEDRKIAPVVGGSAKFRAFIRDELMPLIRARYATTDESAIIGESLAGLFVVETFFLEPDLFDTYIAFDPSLWWNGAELVNGAAARLPQTHPGTLYLAHSSEPTIAEPTRRLEQALRARVRSLHYVPMTDETHATIYHPAALRAVRTLFKPAS